MIRCLTLNSALLFASATVSGASVAEPVAPATKLVRYDDLDLSTARGMKILHGRIEGALDWVCLDPYGPSPAGTVDMACKKDGRRKAFVQAEHAAALQKASRALADAQHVMALPGPQPEPAPKP